MKAPAMISRSILTRYRRSRQGIKSNRSCRRCRIKNKSPIHTRENNRKRTLPSQSKKRNIIKRKKPSPIWSGEVIKSMRQSRSCVSNLIKSKKPSRSLIYLSTDKDLLRS
eukprot:Rmarinus@m.21586